MTPGVIYTFWNCNLSIDLWTSDFYFFLEQLDGEFE